MSDKVKRMILYILANLGVITGVTIVGMIVLILLLVAFALIFGHLPPRFVTWILGGLFGFFVTCPVLHKLKLEKILHGRE